MKQSVFFIYILYISVCSGFLFHGTRRKIQTNRPVIGVVPQSTRGTAFEKFGGPSYIAASYVKFLEASGARVVPIRTDLGEEKIKKLFQNMNGAIFPGGVASLLNSSYANTSRIIFDLAKKTFDDGGYFPIMGMCLGHQLLATLANDLTTEIRIRTDSVNLLAPLNLTNDYRESKLFRNIPDYLAKSANQTPITAHFHKYSLPSKLFQENRKLTDFFKVLTTNVDRKGIEFVSTLEAKKYPFYSTQWHPEKCAFEWALQKKTRHDSTAIELGQYMSNFFVSEARLSSHKFPSEKEIRKAVIYNYQPKYTGTDISYEQVYIF
jgi:gamma-glutamyl hydrolase